MARANRAKAERRGRIAEWGAAMILAFQGYRILERRYRTPVGEIDLIAKRGVMLAFVEVKMRKDLDAAIESVTPAARRRISAAARSFLARNTSLADCQCRYDIIAISMRRFRHLKDAWRDIE